MAAARFAGATGPLASSGPLAKPAHVAAAFGGGLSAAGGAGKPLLMRKGLRERAANEASGPATAAGAAAGLVSDREFFEAEREAYVQTLDEFRNDIVPSLKAKLAAAEEALVRAKDENSARLNGLQRDLDLSRKLQGKAQTERDQALAHVEQARMDIADMQRELQAQKEAAMEANARAEAHKSNAAIAAAALKARELKDGFVQEALDDAQEEVTRLREQLKQAREREQRLDAASDAALHDARAALRKYQEDMHTLTIQCQSGAEARCLVERKLAETEALVLKQKQMLDEEKEKVLLQRNFLIKRLGTDGTAPSSSA